MKPETIKTIGIVGHDRVAAGWAARFLAQGLEVVALAPLPEAAPLRAGVDQAWPVLQKLGLFPGANRNRLRVMPNEAEWVAAIDFIQAGAVSREKLVALERLVPAKMWLAVHDPAYLSAPFKHPQRVVAALVSRPVYLAPLVELMTGPNVENEALEPVAAFYQGLAMRPLSGHIPIADRLQQGLRRAAEALRQEGVSQSDIDAVLQHGPGLQWVISGLSENMDVQRLDEALLGLMRTLRQHQMGAGQFIAAHDAKRYTRFDHQRWQPGQSVTAPLQLYRCHVDPHWIDYNGHMTEASYLTAFGDASDALFRYIGIDEAYRASGFSYYTVETHINYYQECGSGDRLEFTTQILDIDPRRLHLFHSMFLSATGELVATTEQMLLHVDTTAARTAPVKPFVQAALTAVLQAHQSLPVPKQVGRQMRIKKP